MRRTNSSSPLRLVNVLASLAMLSATFVGYSVAEGVTIWGVDSNAAGSSDRLVRFDSSNPAGTIVSVGSTGVTEGIISGIDFDAAGTLFGVSQPLSGGGSFYTIDTATGVATVVGSLNLTVGREITDLTFVPTTGRFVGVAFDGQRNFLYDIDHTSGAASLVGEINAPDSIMLGICADSAGRLFLERVGGRMLALDGLNATPLPQSIGVTTLFSQGMTMNWSDGDAWYLAATWQISGFNAAGDVRLIDNATGGTAQILGAWPQNSNNSYPRYAIGDIAIRPIPEASSALALGLSLIVVAARGRRHEMHTGPRELSSRGPACCI